MVQQLVSELLEVLFVCDNFRLTCIYITFYFIKDQSVLTLNDINAASIIGRHNLVSKDSQRSTVCDCSINACHGVRIPVCRVVTHVDFCKLIFTKTCRQHRAACPQSLNGKAVFLERILQVDSGCELSS